VSALLLVFGLAVAPAPVPVDCTHGVILLHDATASCITPAEANSILVGAGEAQRVGVGVDGRAFVILPSLW
jgi:hypothetical protein